MPGLRQRPCGLIRGKPAATARRLSALTAGVALLAPATAAADTLDAYGNGAIVTNTMVNTLFVFVAAVLVLFMQAGFAMLEIGFSRAKNAGAGVAKILTNLSIAAICYWAVGFALAFGVDDSVMGLFGTDGFGLRGYEGVAPSAALAELGVIAGDPRAAFPVMGLSDAAIEAKWLFQFAFCAVSLAIVWGTTLERIKYSAYVVYAVIFSAFIYPVASHWVFGGGWLQESLGMQDFAGSTAVHLIGATGAFAALLLLGPRKGKYGHDGKPRAIPGHSMPLVGLATLILFIGWFGFNPGSTLNVEDLRFAEVGVVTLLGGAGGVIGAFVATTLMQRTIDIGMIANGMIAGLVGITAPSGYVEFWPAPIIGVVAGLIVVVGVIYIDRKLDDPVGALSAHGLAGIWGTLACGLFTSPRLAEYNAFGDPAGGLWYSGSFQQLGTQAFGVAVVFTFVFAMSFGTFWAIKKTIGLRVTEEAEDAGLDIVEHGMYGYPEQFIPAPEIGADSHGPAVPRRDDGAVAAPTSVGAREVAA
jgi:ammonium transporter, Amt family